MKVVKAAAVQSSPVLYSREATVAKVVQKIHELGQRGVQFATFPETVVPYYPYFSFVRPPFAAGAEHLLLYERAVKVPGPITDAVSAAARSHGVVVVLGVNERDHGSLYNTQLVFDANGELVKDSLKQFATSYINAFAAWVDQVLKK